MLTDAALKNLKPKPKVIVARGDLPTVERIAAACLAIDAFADAAPLCQPGAPAAH